eukprot:4324921-Alexandrium_andersonii.AAC.1
MCIHASTAAHPTALALTIRPWGRRPLPAASRGAASQHARAPSVQLSPQGLLTPRTTCCARTEALPSPGQQGREQA